MRKLQVIAVSGAGHTVVALTVHGLLPDRDYGAHVHAKPCGLTGADAGPHYQHEPDPVQPSTDPAFANADNEVWLDFTTDREGNGVAVAKQAWDFGSVAARLGGAARRAHAHRPRPRRHRRRPPRLPHPGLLTHRSLGFNPALWATSSVPEH